jgi:hypothetical protein
VPAAPAERRRLRALCREMLGLEIHFLAAYREHLLRMLRGDDTSGRRFAVARLGKLAFDDADVRAALAEAVDRDAAPRTG